MLSVGTESALMRIGYLVRMMQILEFASMRNVQSVLECEKGIKGAEKAELSLHSAHGRKLSKSSR